MACGAAKPYEYGHVETRARSGTRNFVVAITAVPAPATIAIAHTMAHVQRGNRPPPRTRPVSEACQNAIVQKVMATVTACPGMPNIEIAPKAISMPRVIHVPGASSRLNLRPQMENHTQQ